MGAPVTLAWLLGVPGPVLLGLALGSAEALALLLAEAGSVGLPVAEWEGRPGEAVVEVEAVREAELLLNPEAVALGLAEAQLL